MTNRDMIQRLQAMVAGGLKAQASVDTAIRAFQLRLPTREDRAILERLTITAQVTYRHGDQVDASMTHSRLTRSGSIVESVGLDVATDLLLERRASR